MNTAASYHMNTGHRSLHSRAQSMSWVASCYCCPPACVDSTALWSCQPHTSRSSYHQLTATDNIILRVLLLLLLLLQPFYGSLDFDPGLPVPEETSIHWHLSWSSIIPYLLPTSFTILLVQFTCLTVFFDNISPSFLWSASYPPFHTPYISSPNHCLLFAAHSHIIVLWISPVAY